MALLPIANGFVKFYVKRHVEHLDQYSTCGNSYFLSVAYIVFFFFLIIYLKEKHTGIMENITNFPLSLRKKMGDLKEFLHILWASLGYTFKRPPIYFYFPLLLQGQFLRSTIYCLKFTYCKLYKHQLKLT